MASGVMSNVAAKVLELLGRLAHQEIASWWGARAELKKLEETITMIQARVDDAERRHEDEDSEMIKKWLVRLRHALYRAEDLVDEVLTDDRQKQQVEMSTLGMVGIFFTRSGPIYYNMKLAHKIKSIRRELHAIKSDMDGLNLKVCVAEELNPSVARLKQNRETASLVQANEIIGRDTDKNRIIERLFDPKYAEDCVHVIPIVGFGGLGKTTVAQLVFNDEKVKNHFDLTKWACVPEVDNHREVVGRIFSSFTDEVNHGFTLEQLQSRIQKSINNKKFLLVLDDFWNENRDQWLCLRSFLQCGRCGSKIIVTTRSDVVADIVSEKSDAYRLGLLGEDESWNLFRSLAYRPGQEDCNPNLTQIGKEIVKKCGNVPLAIRVAGTTLYSKHSEKEWQLFRDAQFSKAKLTENNCIMPELKLSYDYLPPALKQCFAYCSLFPKDYKFNKDELVHLWMAQGYLDPLSEVSSLGHQYFLELLRRNFFQEAEEDYSLNDNIYCKMHDLMHDLAQHVAGEESILVDRPTGHCGDKVMHVALCSTNEDFWREFGEVLSSLLDARKMRSLLFRLHDVEVSRFGWDNINFRCLRTLDLKLLELETVPIFVEELRHLRFLNLSGNYIEFLPDALTRLVNLQTLNLDECRGLKELPGGFTKLVNLRHLGIKGCPITDMPFGFENMESLRELNMFVVGRNTGIHALPGLHLRGELSIRFRVWHREAITQARRVNLKGNERLTHLSLSMGFVDEVCSGDMDDLLECLQLPLHLRYLSVLDFEGERFPRRMLNHLCKLVKVSINFCGSCRILPLFSQLPLLKYLDLQFLGTVEYVDDEENISNDVKCCESSDVASYHDFFPSLESLQLNYMDTLKGWSRVEDGDVQHLMQNQCRCLPQHQTFPCLLRLSIKACPKLMSMPAAPRLELLEVSGVHGNLLTSVLASHDLEASPSSSSSSSTLSTELKWLQIENVDDLESFIFKSPKSIRVLDISNCKSLKNISEGLQHLTILETLRILSCEELDLWDESDDNHIINEEPEEAKGRTLSIRACQGLKSLRSLYLWSILKLEVLPSGITCLSTLHSLTIHNLLNLTALPEQIGDLSELRWLSIENCPKLASLPQSFRSLTSLQQLRIIKCPVLEKRCLRPDGEDWPLIQHIPDL